MLNLELWYLSHGQAEMMKVGILVEWIALLRKVKGGDERSVVRTLL